VALLDGPFIHTDDLRDQLRCLSQPGRHGPPVPILDRVLRQVQPLSDGLVRHVPAQGADVVSEPLRIARVLGQPVQALHLPP